MSDRAWPETTLNPRMHCRGTHRQEWLAPIRLAGRPLSQTCGTSGMEPADIAHSGLRAGAASPASGRREPRCETGTMVFTSAAPAASPSPATLRYSAAPAEGPCPAHRGIRRRRSRFVLVPERSHCSTARAEGPRPFHSPGAVGTPGSTASPLTAQPVRRCQFSTFLPSQRLSRELELAHDVAAVAGFSAGCPSEAGSQQHYNASKFDHSRWPAAAPSRLQAT